MARPSNATIVSVTPGGIPYQQLVDGYQEKGARDAGMVVLQVLVAWELATAFLKEAVGYTTWNIDAKASTLTRVLPLVCPTRSDLWCTDYHLVSVGAYPERSDFNNPLNPTANTIDQDWCIYELVYTRPRHVVRSDSELAQPAYGNREQERYTIVSDLPRPRLQIVSGNGYLYDTSPNGTGIGPWQPVPEERQSISDYTVELAVTWLQVPIRAVPYDAILKRLNTVNKTPINLVSGGRIWMPGQLLFKGLARPLEQYAGADDGLYVDIVYKWAASPYGWNNYITRDTVTGLIKPKPLRVRDPSTGNPTALSPYVEAEHQRLFVPDIDVGGLP